MTSATVERPILFSADMVRAIRAGRKTQTRRLVKPQPFSDGYYDGAIFCDRIPPRGAAYGDGYRFSASAVGGGAILTEAYFPPVEPGDRLWVRENWRTHKYLDRVKPRDLPDVAPIFHEAGTGLDTPLPAIAGRLRPAIHMPKRANRLSLIVDAVKVERLHEIDLAGALAEGCTFQQFSLFGADRAEGDETGRSAFSALWDRINGKRGGGAYAWAANPWVVVIGFHVDGMK